MPELYLSGGDTLQSVDNPNWQGQTFMLQEDFVLEFVDLEMRGGMIVPEPVIQVFHAEITGEPWGDCLSRNRYIVEKKCGLFTTGRVRFSMQAVLLARPARYVLIVQNYPGLLGSGASWQYDKDDATYPRGMRMSSNDSGTTWTPHPNDDFMFAIFGNPPLPKSEPPPPIDNFAVLQAKYRHWLSSITFTFVTSVPCHLFCYYTDKKPLRHRAERIVRGLLVPWGAHFCFVAWKTAEQIELGDTISHTFEIPDWAYCQTKWFTFRGAVDEEENTWTDHFTQDLALFYEPWGTILNENYPWIPAGDPGPPTWTLVGGILTLDFKDTQHSGITYNPPFETLPLQSPSSSPCYAYLDVPDVKAPATGDLVVHGFEFTKGTETFLLYLMHTITYAGPFSTPYGFGFVSGRRVGWLFIGTGIHKVNLLAFFQELAQYFNLSQDPSGWWMSYMEIAHRCWYAPPISWIQSNTLAIYYPLPKTRQEIDSPSVGPIFKHHHSGQALILNPSFEQWSAPPGDAPDYWQYPPGPHHNVLYPDPTIKTLGDFSCRIDNPTAVGNFRIHQDLDVTELSGRPLTFKLAYRGKKHNFNWFRLRAEGDTNIWVTAHPTKEYEWEDLVLSVTLPTNLTRLYLQAQNWNQNYPTPFQTWFDNCRVDYTP